MKKQSGFTLIELVITIAIISILLVVGVPSLKTFMQGNQLVATSNDLVSALHIARSEAVRLESRVTICESDNGTSCLSPGTGNWKNGWIVFVDANGDLGGTGSICSALNTDCLLRVHGVVTDPLLSVTGVNAGGVSLSSITFTSRGLPKAVSGISQTAVFSVCSFDESDNVIGSRAVVLSLPGRARISTNSAVITCPATPV